MSKIVFTILILSLSFQSYSHAKKQNVIIIVIDTLAANHLQSYGYYRKTAPYINSFGKKSILFKNAYTNASYTLPSHATLFTGVFPNLHNITSLFKKNTLPKKYKTIFEILKKKDYQTSAFFREKKELSRKFGFFRGVDYFSLYDAFDPAHSQRVKKWFNKQNHEQKSFIAFMHTNLVHTPYLSTNKELQLFTNKNYKGQIIGDSEKFIEYLKKKEVQKKRKQDKINEKLIYKNHFFSKNNPKSKYMHGKNIWKSMVKYYNPTDDQRLKNLYDANILFLDKQLEKFFTFFNKLEISKNTIIILTSDHGETFNKNGLYYHANLYKDVLHIPLMLKIPNLKPKIIKQDVQLADIVPTILTLLSIKDSKVSGVSLYPLIKNIKTENIHQHIISYSVNHSLSILNQKYKFIYYPQQLNETYNRIKDSKEEKNITNKVNTNYFLQLAKKQLY